MNGDSEYHCPSCRSPLSSEPGHYLCSECERTYPIVCGIPDFRLFADPYIGVQEDREKAERLERKATELGFPGIVHHYFEVTPEVPPELAQRYTRWLLETGELRGRNVVEQVVRRGGARPRDARVIELGAGSGPFLPVLCERFDRVTALDIALRWLVIARARMRAQGRDDVRFVCACAEHLPFAENRFDRVFAAGLLEHTRAPQSALREALRCLDRDGIATFTTPNRWSPLPDPHLGIWGLGLLPSAWARRAARLVRGLEYDKIKTLSYFELQRLFSEAGFRRFEIHLPQVDPRELPAKLAAVGRAYEWLRSKRGLRLPLYLFGPAFQVIAYKGPNR